MQVLHEPQVPLAVLKGLEDRGHILATVPTLAVAQAVAREDDQALTAHSDSRKGGAADGF